MIKNIVGNKGLTLLEIIIVIAIIIVIIAFVFPNLSNFRQQQNLKNTTGEIISLLNNARSKTISSLNSSAYGVHFEENRAVLFQGTIFNDTDPLNEVVNFDSSVLIPSSDGINLNGSDSDVIFQRLTGATQNYGTIILQLSQDDTKQKIISINKVGVISLN